MKKSIAVENEELCFCCCKPKEAVHHLIFGSGLRTLADEDGLTVPICNNHHNFAVFRPEQIHENSMAEYLSKCVGQTVWEREEIAKELSELTGEPVESIKERINLRFMDRYGRSWL